jgi:hypothetical protein
VIGAGPFAHAVPENVSVVKTGERDRRIYSHHSRYVRGQCITQLPSPIVGRPPPEG